jgi:hypothetical protein
LKAEHVAANAEIDELVRALKLCTQRAERVEARVREAPVAEVIRRDCMNTCIFAPEDDELQARIDALHGKRVALVLLDTEEAK